jgi:DnaJ-domain-containing protein 1
MDTNIFNDKKLLTRFISKLRILPDTPTLIQFIAGDEEYLLLCSRIVNDASSGSQDLAAVKDICLKQEFDFQLLKERLTPVARAFGLAEDHSSYYELLGVPRDADPDRIKKAFRKKAVEVHPDTGKQTSDSNQEFINLKTAYQILDDPSLRQQYDENLQNVSHWKERTDPGGLNNRDFQKINQNQPARTKIYYQLGGLFLLLIIVVFIFDFLYRQSALLENDYSIKQKQTQEQKLKSAVVTEDSASKTGPNKPEAKSSTNTTEAHPKRTQQHLLTDHYSK